MSKTTGPKGLFILERKPLAIKQLPKGYRLISHQLLDYRVRTSTQIRTEIIYMFIYESVKTKTIQWYESPKYKISTRLSSAHIRLIVIC